MSQLVGIAPPTQSGLVVAPSTTPKKLALERWMTITIVLLAIMKWMVTPDQMLHSNDIIRNVAVYRTQIMYALLVVLVILAARYYQLSLVTDLTNWVPVLPSN
jgi:hypothetical protein